MEVLEVVGGKSLSGELEIESAKNSLLPIIACSIINGKKVVINKFSKYSDVLCMLEILKDIGCVCEIDGDCLIIDSSNACKNLIKEELAKCVRSSVFMIGPLLSRFRSAKVSYPGGCNIGSRPIDLHIKGLKCLGVKVFERHGYIVCDGENMRCGDIHLDFPSVGATENLMMASVCLKGITRIYNPAREPEIIDLQNFLNTMGCKVYGAGSSVITIEGVDNLLNVEYTPIKDRIITGTYMIGCAMCGGDIRLIGAKTHDNLSLIDKLRYSGVTIEEMNDGLRVISNRRLKCIPQIETQPYPGFPTDMQNQILTMLTIAKGTSLITENLFESRFNVCGELSKMGADIVVKDRTAIVKGVNALSGANVRATDLRCGASLVLAGLVANGYTTIEDIYHIDRGYLSIEEDFCKLGGEIRRITT